MHIPRMILPTSSSASFLRVISFGVILPFTLIGLVISRDKWRLLLPVYAFLIVHTGIHAISWTMIRYRIPMDVFFIMFASVSILWIYERIKPVFVNKFHLSEPEPSTLHAKKT